MEYIRAEAEVQNMEFVPDYGIRITILVYKFYLDSNIQVRNGFEIRCTIFMLII